jgi:hypothetical protein
MLCALKRELSLSDKDSDFLFLYTFFINGTNNIIHSPILKNSTRHYSKQTLQSMKKVMK